MANPKTNFVGPFDPNNAAAQDISYDDLAVLPPQLGSPTPIISVQAAIDKLKQAVAGGGDAIGLDVIWRQGAVGVLPFNVFTTWPTALAAAQAAQGGPVTIGVDISLAPAVVPAAAMPAGGWDLQSRIFLVGVGPVNAQPLMTVADGATLLNAPGGENLRPTGTALAAGSNLPSLSYTVSLAPVWKNVVIDASNCTRRMIDVAGGVILQPTSFNFGGYQTGPVGAEVYNLLAAGAFCFVEEIGGVDITPATNFIGGAGHFGLTRDAGSGPVLMTAAYTGPAPLITFRDNIRTDRVTALGAGTLTIDSGAALTSAQFPECIYVKPTGVGTSILQLPDATLPMNAGRFIKVVDANGTSAANPITVTPFGAQNLNGANVSQSLGNPWGIWFLQCDGAQWIVALSATGPVTTTGINYQLAEAADETVNCTAVGLTITIPMGLPIGKTFTVIDSSGGAGGNAFTIQPAAGESVGATGLGVAAVYTQALVKALTFKKVSATNYRMVSLTNTT